MRQQSGGWIIVLLLTVAFVENQFRKQFEWLEHSQIGSCSIVDNRIQQQASPTIDWWIIRVLDTEASQQQVSATIDRLIIRVLDTEALLETDYGNNLVHGSESCC